MSAREEEELVPQRATAPTSLSSGGAGVDQARVEPWDSLAVNPSTGVFAWLLRCPEKELMALKGEEQSCERSRDKPGVFPGRFQDQGWD